MHHTFERFAPAGFAAPAWPGRAHRQRDRCGDDARELLADRGVLFVSPGDRSMPGRSSANTAATTTWW